MINSILFLTAAAAPALRYPVKSFGANDPNGIAMTIIAMGVVFAALILLYVIFKSVAKLYGRETKKKTVPLKPESETSGEINAALALALHLYRTQLHDNEDAVITMKRVARSYSPWSSKIYGLTKIPK